MPQHKTFPLGNLRGNRRLYARVSDEFHQLVFEAARRQGLSIQDYVIAAVRDRMAGEPSPSEDIHYQIIQTIQGALQSRKTPADLREAIHSFVAFLRSRLPVTH